MDVSPAAAQPSGQPVASIRFIRHGLLVQPPNLPAQQGRVKEQLYAAYGLQTQAGEQASLGFRDGTVLYMNQRTELVLKGPVRSLLKQGEVALVRQPGTRHTIRTATALAVAIGTVFDVRIAAAGGLTVPATPVPRVFPPGTTTVSVTQGTVRVSNRFGAVTVQPGHWTHVAPGKAPTAPTVHNARADIRWTAGLP
jgi:ferric-dicitrate binding protein FerR (iron transport regulator)